MSARIATILHHSALIPEVLKICQNKKCCVGSRPKKPTTKKRMNFRSSVPFLYMNNRTLSIGLLCVLEIVINFILAENSLKTRVL